MHDTCAGKMLIIPYSSDYIQGFAQDELLISRSAVSSIREWCESIQARNSERRSRDTSEHPRWVFKVPQIRRFFCYSDVSVGLGLLWGRVTLAVFSR
jgi:hypothetical protein